MIETSLEMAQRADDTLYVEWTRVLPEGEYPLYRVSVYQDARRHVTAMVKPDSS